MMAVINPNITNVMIDGGVFQDEVKERKIMSVPSVFLNGEEFGIGRMEFDEILAKVDKGAVAREAKKLDAKAPYDVLIVGGGPAGASAAIYSARKGIRTGIVAERFGGQVMDTLAIENFISVKETMMSTPYILTCSSSAMTNLGPSVSFTEMKFSMASVSMT